MSSPAEPMPRRPSEPGPQEKRAQFWATITRRLVLAALAVGILALLALNTYGVMLTRATQVQNTPTLKSAAAAAKAAKDSAQRIIDCTTVGHPCYEKGRRRGEALGAAVSRANTLASAAAASCAVDHRDASFKVIFACTRARVAAVRPPREARP